VPSCLYRNMRSAPLQAYFPSPVFSSLATAARPMATRCGFSILVQSAFVSVIHLILLGIFRYASPVRNAVEAVSFATVQAGRIPITNNWSRADLQFCATSQTVLELRQGVAILGSNWYYYILLRCQRRDFANPAAMAQDSRTPICF
jgi:hypothetical protein